MKIKVNLIVKTQINCVFAQDRSRSEEQKDAAHLDSYVVQRYIENPYLINGNK